MLTRASCKVAVSGLFGGANAPLFLRHFQHCADCWWPPTVCRAEGLPAAQQQPQPARRREEGRPSTSRAGTDRGEPFPRAPADSASAPGARLQSSLCRACERPAGAGAAAACVINKHRGSKSPSTKHLPLPQPSRRHAAEPPAGELPLRKEREGAATTGVCQSRRQTASVCRAASGLRALSLGSPRTQGNGSRLAQRHGPPSEVSAVPPWPKVGRGRGAPSVALLEPVGKRGPRLKCSGGRGLAAGKERKYLRTCQSG